MKSGKTSQRRHYQTAAPPAPPPPAPPTATMPARFTASTQIAGAAPPVSPSRRGPQPLYFVNAPVDFALAGGTSIIAFLLLRMFHSGERVAVVYTTAAALSWVVNWPHFSATSYRLYHDRAYLAIPRDRPRHSLAHRGGRDRFRLLTHGRRALLHQNVPRLVSVSLQRTNAGRVSDLCAAGGLLRRQVGAAALSTFIFGTFATQNARFEVNPEGASYYGIAYPGLGLPAWTVTVLSTAMYAGGAAFLVMAIRWCLRERRWLPPIVLLPALTQFVWFIPGNEWASFQEFVPFFHSLQYLLIAWSVQLKEKLDKDHLAPGVSYVLRESTRWGLLNILGGTILFFMLPSPACGNGSGADVRDRHCPYRCPGPSLLRRWRHLEVATHDAFLAIDGQSVRNAGAAHAPGRRRMRFPIGIALISLLAGAGAAAAESPRKGPERVVFNTPAGDLVFALYPDVAPANVRQFLTLVEQGVYDSTRFGRLEPGFVLQLFMAEDRRVTLSDSQRALLEAREGRVQQDSAPPRSPVDGKARQRREQRLFVIFDPARPGAASRRELHRVRRGRTRHGRGG